MLNKQDHRRYAPIGWTDFTWNPIKGCRYNCYYCYMRRLAGYSGDVRRYVFRPGELNAPFSTRRPAKIFVGSAGEMFGDWVPSEHIEAVLEVERYLERRHVFQHLTKNPKRYAEFQALYRPNLWLGTTVDGLSFTRGNIEDLLEATAGVEGVIRWVSFEPLVQSVSWAELAGLDWIVIGGDSTVGAEKPLRVWADSLIEKAREVGAAVWVKDNYQYPRRIKEFPKHVAAPEPAKQAGLFA